MLSDARSSRARRPQFSPHHTYSRSKSVEQARYCTDVWDRINAAEQKWDAIGLLLRVVGFHEHSHAARTASLLQHAEPTVQQAEETLAQWESYMFVRSRTHTSTAKAIKAMKDLMGEQPNCYRIPHTLMPHRGCYFALRHEFRRRNLTLSLLQTVPKRLPRVLL
jgi:DNA-binding FrmR family transcriptional regulator